MRAAIKKEIINQLVVSGTEADRIEVIEVVIHTTHPGTDAVGLELHRLQELLEASVSLNMT